MLEVPFFVSEDALRLSMSARDGRSIAKVRADRTSKTRFDSRQHIVERRLGAPPRKTLRVAQVVSSSHNRPLADQAAPSTNLSTHAVGVDRTAPAIYDDLYNCVGWPPSDSSSSTVFDSHSVPSEARVLTCKPSLKTVDSLFFTGKKDARKSVSFAEQHSQTQRKRTEAFIGSFDGPVIDIALVACGLSSTLLFSQNAASRSSCDLESPLYQSLPLNVKCIVGIKSDLTSLASANGTNVAKYGDLVALVWDLKTNKRSVTPIQVQGMELTMPCLRETVMNVHNLGGLLPIEVRVFTQQPT